MAPSTRDAPRSPPRSRLRPRSRRRAPSKTKTGSRPKTRKPASLGEALITLTQTFVDAVVDACATARTTELVALADKAAARKLPRSSVPKPRVRRRRVRARVRAPAAAKKARRHEPPRVRKRRSEVEIRRQAARIVATVTRHGGVGATAEGLRAEHLHDLLAKSTGLSRKHLYAPLQHALLHLGLAKTGNRRTTRYFVRAVATQTATARDTTTTGAPAASPATRESHDGDPRLNGSPVPSVEHAR